MDELLLRELTPAVIGVLVHRGVDFATAEDAVQEALIQAALTWPDRQPADPKGWLVTVAWRKFLDAHRWGSTSRPGAADRASRRPDRPGPQTTRCSFSSCAPIRRCPGLLWPSRCAPSGLTTRQIARPTSCRR
jgi:predicted RNA polymerase sigma factor